MVRSVKAAEAWAKMAVAILTVTKLIVAMVAMVVVVDGRHSSSKSVA